MTNWKELLSEALSARGETVADIESITLSETELTSRFDDGFGCTEGEPFTAWTRNHVYFPACYDGAEWVGSVPRHPNGKATRHIGSG